VIGGINVGVETRRVPDIGPGQLRWNGRPGQEPATTVDGKRQTTRVEGAIEHKDPNVGMITCTHMPLTTRVRRRVVSRTTAICRQYLDLGARRSRCG
jgi:hypothetical protein